MEVIVVAEPSALEECRNHLKGATVVALDCEGLHLGRLGTLSLVQLSVETPMGIVCFLFDVLKRSPHDPIVLFLKNVLEDETITKVIHDCRQDSDALFHLLGIKLKKVHDTECWHEALGNLQPLGLNQMLEAYAIKANQHRDSKVYSDSPDFWLQRPLTAQMKEGAAGDVQSLFELYRKQMALASPHQKSQGALLSCDFAERLLTAEVETFPIHPSQMKFFIGKGGANVKDFEKRSKLVKVTSMTGPGQKGRDTPLFYGTRSAIETAKVLAQPFTRPAFTAMVSIHPDKMGVYIGRQGSNIKHLQDTTGARFDSPYRDTTVVVTAHDQASLDTALAALEEYQKAPNPKTQQNRNRNRK
uniref:3'-5' exonuclease domain-containing protein n=1 Tax=Chromera velia CCMP2878 TaxID=1169474 RepID=A0A0G4I363_9ALVE|eukprot:Cvel_1744.t1-p1 / transcript=Cvel_1744.t1 / gene=Cvel_1744 / organism=Chromera_velia_CCMP2878 / gene_product=Exonuclease 3'-5' domain-containing protein 1, putative / transcript_product=Exonuclease 3'-5' domain-containing protein 1, putative / location=Cvel_scaffold63:116906-117976(+) / protein_length=357 / sequence_SO=supercontig / SO=protein_coding / is_pseudo=false